MEVWLTCVGLFGWSVLFIIIDAYRGVIGSFWLTCVGLFGWSVLFIIIDACRGLLEVSG